MPEDSLAALEAASKRGAGPELRHALGKRLWEQGRWEPAAASFADVNPQDPSSDATLVALKAITLANLGKSAEAESARTALSGRKLAAAKAWVLLLRRIIDAAQLDDKQVVAACRAALQLDSHNPYLAYYLGDADARLGELDQAVQAWRVAEAYDGTWNVPGVRLVEALLQGNHPDQAQWIATDAIRHNHTAGAAIALARAYSSGNTANAEQIAQVGKLVDQIQLVLHDEQTQVVRIEWLCRQDKKAEARDAALAAVNRQPAPSEQFLIAIADKSRQYGLGIQSDCLAASRKAHGVTPGLAYAQAIDRFLAGQKDQAVSGFDADARAAGKPQDLSWRQARAELLDFAASPDAKAAWIKLSDEFPNDISVQHAFLNARSLQGDWDAMGKAINRLKSLAGENTVAWRLAQARLMVLSPRTDGDYEQGALVLNDLLKLDPTSTAAHELLARALVHMKRIDGAIEQLSIAAKQDSSSVPIALELAALLQSRGDFDRVQKELDRVTSWIHSPSERKQAAAILAQQGNSEGALDLLEHPTTRPGEDSTEAQPDLLAAELYRRRREFDKAEQVAGKLLEHPDLATIRFAASLYVQAGHMDQARAALARLDELKLGPGMKELALGGFCVETGQLAEGIKHYQAATTEAPSNPVAWRVLATCQFAAGDA
ncbi:MAG TPA: tetratricopeptide repeat protein, partial [Pirellulales bacterium]|nr:tetratricopeptide repeat protein [Pirellulales bacterium]